MEVVYFFLFLVVSTMSVSASPDYLTALRSSILFFEGQRSGFLPANQRAAWRSHSGLKDGFDQGVNLVGGYYDAGDNVKFGLPMAFTITMLSWSVLEYGHYMRMAGEYGHALQAIKWGTDYFIKAHPQPNILWGEVGDGDTDHYCWQRPEDMTTSRRAYHISESNPGSDLAGETAAAMAAASIVFRHSRPSYSKLLVAHAEQLFQFADTHRGRYDSSIKVARMYYASESGYNDELLWAAFWLYEATADERYINYAVDNAQNLGGTGWAMTEFSWDVKYAGLQVLATKILLQGRGSNAEVLKQYQSKAEFFMCACLQKNQDKNIGRTSGGLIYKRAWNNMQYVTSASFLMTVYSDYLSKSHQHLQCPTGQVGGNELLNMAKSQVDYILGNNPRGTSYMVGVGSNYPQKIHHRGASIVSYKVDSSFIACRMGYETWFSYGSADPNIHVGAVVGGPDENDNYADDRADFEQSEPATYNNAPLVGVLARMYGLSTTYRSQHSTAAASPLSRLYISHILTSSWNFEGRRYYRYEVNIKNNSPRMLQFLKLTVEGLKGPLWGLSKSGPATFAFPPWLKALAPQKSLVFVYIHQAPKATITVSTAVFD